MATSQRDVRNRIDAVKNIRKITRAMEMVAAARLRRAEQRIEALRPYADAIRRMTRQAAEAAGDLPRLPILQDLRRETLLPLQRATVLEEEEDEDEDRDEERSEKRALVEYEPDPEEILKRLVPDYVEISIYRALLESTASEHGARMTAMRNASENAGELIDDLTLEMNRARQAEITQEIMEVVAGAEALG